MSANANCFSRVFVYIQIKWFMCESSHRSMVRNWRRRWKNGRNCNKLSLRSHYNELTILQSILIAFESRTEPSAIRIALTAHDLFGMWLSAREYLLNSSNTVLIRVACSKHSLSRSLLPLSHHIHPKAFMECSVYDLISVLSMYGIAFRMIYLTLALTRVRFVHVDSIQIIFYCELIKFTLRRAINALRISLDTELVSTIEWCVDVECVGLWHRFSVACIEIGKISICGSKC